MNIQPRTTRHDPPPPEPGAEYDASHVVLLRRITELEARVEKLEADRRPTPLPDRTGGRYRK